MNPESDLIASSMSYLAHNLEARWLPGKGHCAIFALTTIETGELLAVWGGIIVNYQQLFLLDEIQQQHSIQVEDGLYLAPLGGPEPADCFNHSCAPNAGLRGQVALVAMKRIEPGEEVCFDYAMSDASPYDEFECSCGAANCRKMITGQDWQLPDLWQRYQGYFSPYIQRKINALQELPPLDPRGQARNPAGLSRKG